MLAPSFIYTQACIKFYLQAWGFFIEKWKLIAEIAVNS